jgi:hypothetical protein
MSQDPQKPRIDLHDERRSFRDSLFPGILRRTLETAAATEDAIRGVVGDIKMPKEVATYIIEVADTTKKEVVRVAAREFREFLESANLTEELAKILTTLSFEIRTEIRFIPNDQALRPTVKSHVRLKSQDGEIDEPVRRDSKLVEGIDDIMRGVAGDLTERLLRRKKDSVTTDEPDADSAPKGNDGKGAQHGSGRAAASSAKRNSSTSDSRGSKPASAASPSSASGSTTTATRADTESAAKTTSPSSSSKSSSTASPRSTTRSTRSRTKASKASSSSASDSKGSRKS